MAEKKILTFISNEMHIEAAKISKEPLKPQQIIDSTLQIYKSFQSKL